MDKCVAILSAVIHGVAFRYYDFGQRRALPLESSNLLKHPSNRIVATGHLSNTCDAGGNSYGFQRFALEESPLSNTRHTISNNNGGKGGAIIESPLSNTRHTISNNNGGKGGATTESILSNTRHTIGDNNGGKGGALIESSSSNTRHTIRDNNGGKGFAFIESFLCNTRDAISDFVKYYGLRNNNITFVTHLLTDFCCQFVLVEAVLDTINNFYSHVILMIYVVSCCKGSIFL